jgi:3-oxoacyl-ACP reductase-like protein
MGIFSNILNKIFPSNHPAVTASQEQTSTPDVAAAANAASDAAAASAASSAAAAAAANTPPVDVGAVLAALAAKNPQKLNYQTSIVDLMKLLDLDSSLGARKDLAKELGYTGDTNDSAAMNIWLHKQVMLKLEQNGGRVPDEMKH